MGLAWAGGCSLEWRRRGTVLVLTALGALEAAALLVPYVGDNVGADATPWLIAASGASALARAALMKAQRGRGAPAA
jgi:hypothetical protein